MKKLLMGSIVLTMFSISMLVFQFSCKKDANAQTTTGNNLVQLNQIIYLKSITSGTTSTNQVSTSELWTANFDGTNAKKIPVVLPSDVNIVTYPKLSPDGKMVIFETSRPSSITGRDLKEIYTCLVDGSNLKKIISGNVTDAFNYERVFLCGAN